jgi:nascent polypeptide-associated complex subunit alpha
MIPGMGGMNARQAQRMMAQMGIKTEEVKAAEVIVKREDGSELVFSAPQVTLMEMQGQKILQVSGQMAEREGGPSDGDVKLVMEQAGVEKDKAIAALKEAKGDIADAILKLSQEK